MHPLTQPPRLLAMASAQLHLLWRGLLLCQLLCLLLAAPAAQAAGERRFALVIGNSAYLEGPLRNPVNDARDIRAKLLQLGFAPADIVYRENLRREQIGSTLREFRAKLQASPGAVALVFYAGHGVQFKGENYFPVVDAKLEGEEDTPLQSLHLRSLMDVLSESRTRLNLLFLDACRNNPFARSFRNGTRGLGRTAEALPSGTLIAYATSANSVAADGNGRNAPFTAALLQHMSTPGQPVEQVLKRVVRSVRDDTQGAQVPWSEGSIDGDFYFRPGSGTGFNPNANVVPEPVTPGLDLSDLAGQAARQAEADRREQAALARMQADFDKVTGFTGAAALQAQAWERFLAAWTANNAPGANGQALRTQAEQRLAQARVEANRPAPQPVPVTTTANASGKACPECPETVLIQPGSFQMGSPSGESGRDSDEGPVRTVRIGQQLAVGKNHITRGEFATFVSASGYRTEAEQGDGCTIWTGSEWKRTAGRNWRNPGFEQGSNHPVVCVSWNDAQKYIEWLNDKSPVKGWRLLTEAEWEYAARAGSSTRYYWGDDSGNNQQCQFANGADQSAKRTWNPSWTTPNCDDGHAYTAPVGRYKANAWGLHDMAGNAWQWTQDCYAQSYDGAPTNGQAVNPSSCSLRVLRGGAWLVTPQGLRSTNRSRGTPDYRDNYAGFRLARTVF